jgi:hypothetical protein
VRNKTRHASGRHGVDERPSAQVEQDEAVAPRILDNDAPAYFDVERPLNYAPARAFERT